MLFKYTKSEKQYTPLPKFPAVTRDIAVICDENIPVLTFEKAMKKSAGSTLESVKLFDVYQGEQIEKGKKNVAFRITMRSHNETLTDEHANSTMKKIMKALENEGAVLRA